MKNILLVFINFFILISILNAQIRQETVNYYSANIDNSIGSNRQYVKIDQSGNYIISCLKESNKTGRDFAILKYSSDGNLIWEATYNGYENGYDESKAVVLDHSGNIYVTGKSFSKEGNFVCVTLRIDKHGKTDWVNKHQSLYGNSEGNSIAIDADGNIFVAGSSGTEDGPKMLLLKIGVDGKTLWNRILGENKNLYGFSFCVKVYGNNIYSCGGSSAENQSSDFTTLKYDMYGNLIWHRALNGDDNLFDNANSVFIDESENVFVTGCSESQKTSEDIISIKYDKRGNLLWKTSFNGTANGSDWSNHIKVDNRGNAYICGGSQNVNVHNPDNLNDATVIKYKPSGEIDWVHKYDGPDHFHDCFQGLDLDFEGNVYVTGRSHSYYYLTHDDLIILKFSPDGTRQWLVRYNSEGSNLEYGSDIILDQTGNVYVTGTINRTGLFDMIVLKYSQTNISINDSFKGNINLSNYPNPFNPTTKITYGLPASKSGVHNVSIKIYNSLGKEVESLINEVQSSGIHSVEWNASEYSSGVYFYKLETEYYSELKKMTLIK